MDNATLRLGTSFDGFDWDDGNRAKCAKHLLIQEAIEALFGRSLLVQADPFPGESRFRAIGRGVDGRAVFLVFTTRERNNVRLIRPISARYMHQREINAYQETLPDISK